MANEQAMRILERWNFQHGNITYRFCSAESFIKISSFISTKDFFLEFRDAILTNGCQRSISGRSNSDAKQPLAFLVRTYVYSVLFRIMQNSMRLHSDHPSIGTCMLSIHLRMVSVRLVYAYWGHSSKPVKEPIFWKIFSESFKGA